MKTNYEIKLESPALTNGLDLETIKHYPVDTYREGAYKARELSRRIPFHDEDTGRRIVVIELVGYTRTKDTDYALQWFEQYENGKCCGRVNINEEF